MASGARIAGVAMLHWVDNNAIPRLKQVGRLGYRTYLNYLAGLA